FDATTLTKRFEAALDREPRAVVISDDGKQAIVSHAVGSILSRVDLGGRHAVETVGITEKDATRQTVVGLRFNPMDNGRGRACQNYALVKSVEPRGRLLAPQVIVDPGDATQQATGYGDPDQPTEVASVAVIDDATFAL